MKQRFSVCMLGLLLALILLATPLAVSADIGPKPSVRIRFENMGKELCYATLLSEEPSTGPQSVWDGDEEHIYNYDLDIDIWRAFAEYEDSDGFCFLQVASKVNETAEYAWTYYPPQTFKVLLYYPESGTFAVSGICERVAFDTYYTVDMAADSLNAVYDETASGNKRLDAYRSKQYADFFLPLLARIALTVLVEMGVALLFGFRGRRALLLLVGVNTLTQILLNLALYASMLSGVASVLSDVLRFESSYAEFVFTYLLLELAVFALEAFLYVKCAGRVEKTPREPKFYVIYALLANIVSFAGGVVISGFLPELF